MFNQKLIKGAFAAGLTLAVFLFFAGCGENNGENGKEVLNKNEVQEPLGKKRFQKNLKPQKQGPSQSRGQAKGRMVSGKVIAPSQDKQKSESVDDTGTLRSEPKHRKVICGHEVRD